MEKENNRESPSRTPPQSMTQNLFSAFLKRSNKPKEESPSSTRKSIFNRIQTSALEDVKPTKKNVSFEEVPVKKTSAELRELWQTAINQQLLLIQMQKANRTREGRTFKTFAMRIFFKAF